MVNLYQAFALAIVVLMVASMVGYSFLTAPDTTQTDDTPDVSPDGPQVLQDIRAFKAEGVEAEVVQLFPVVMVTAGTNETEIYKIDEAIYGIPGVTQVSSQYNTQNISLTGSNLIYIGTVFFDPSFEKEDIVAAIGELPDLTVTDVVQTGLVKVPVEARLQAEDDVNLFKEHRFEEPFMEAILSFETLKDDKVEVLQRIVFNGDQILQAMVFEMKNLTGEPIMFGVNLQNIELMELKPSFTFGARSVYEGSVDFGWLEAEMEAMTEVENASLEVQPVQYQIILMIDKNISGAVLTDLNYSLHALEGVEKARFWHRDGFDEITLDFEPAADYAALKTGISQSFTESGASYQVTGEPAVHIFGELETNIAQSQDFNQSFNRLLHDNKFFDIDLFQSALADLETVEFVGPDVILHLDENQTVQEVFVYPGHQVNDLIELDVSVYGAREKVQRVSAFEKEN